MKELSAEISAVPEQTKRGTKNPRQQTGFLRKVLLFLGCLVFLLGAAGFYRIYSVEPKPLDVLYKRVYFSYATGGRPLYQNSTPLDRTDVAVLTTGDATIDNLAPFELYLYYKELRNLNFSYNFHDNYQSVKDTRNIWLTVTGIVAGAGLSLIVLSFFMPKRSIEVIGWSGSDWK